MYLGSIVEMYVFIVCYFYISWKSIVSAFFFKSNEFDV